MKANVTLKESFVKRRISGSNEISGYVNLSNGNILNVYFILDKKIIEIEQKNEQNKNIKLSEEERLSIIEELLIKYTSLLRSIGNFTISYCIEQFKLIEAASLKYYNVSLEEQAKTTKTLLEEYISSDYSKNSINIVFRTLKLVYDKLITKKDVIGKEEIVINTEYNLNYFQKVDLNYYIVTILHLLLEDAKNINVVISKEDKLVIIK